MCAQAMNRYATSLLPPSKKWRARGVYDQLAGGFHRYSVDERWVVPHFEKMCYDNSELLKNYVHGYQATGSVILRLCGARHHSLDGEWLSDHEVAASTRRRTPITPWTMTADYLPGLCRKRRRFSRRRTSRRQPALYINEIGEMHHNPAKNVLYVRASVEEIEKRWAAPDEIRRLLQSAKKKM